MFEEEGRRIVPFDHKFIAPGRTLLHVDDLKPANEWLEFLITSCDLVLILSQQYVFCQGWDVIESEPFYFYKSSTDNQYFILKDRFGHIFLHPKYIVRDTEQQIFKSADVGVQRKGVETEMPAVNEGEGKTGKSAKGSCSPVSTDNRLPSTSGRCTTTDGNDSGGESEDGGGQHPGTLKTSAQKEEGGSEGDANQIPKKPVQLKTEEAHSAENN
ncbi:hypothetical protein R1sor_007137 [Riccia sorocarpa]|uniref:Uncharacterized protein n=1 Tax=Riccia sorocarpa TaxID=122646 RepID=A0ABD3HRU1_9MARC